MMVAPYRTKKHLKQSIGQPFRFEETSFFGPEYKGDGVYTVVGPGAYERKWYATVTVKDGLVSKVNPGRARFCPERVAAPSAFDRRSFRTVRVKGHRVTVGCPMGYYDAQRRRCRVSTRAQRILHPVGEGKCPVPRELGRNPRRSTLAELERQLRAYERLGLAAAAAKTRKQIAAMRRAGERLRQFQFRTRPARENPGGTKIYDRVLAVVAERDGPDGGRFVHRVDTAAPIFGTPDGGLRIPPSAGRLQHPAKIRIPGGPGGQRIIIE
jgi:hypothetical protein